MEATHSTVSKLHPVLWVAAVAVILLSLAGIAAIFGVIPTAGSKNTDPAAALPAAVPAPVAAVPATIPAPGEKPAPAAAESQPAKKVEAPKPAPKPQPVKASPAPAPIAAVDAPPKPAPKPAICLDCGVVESVREVKKEGEGTGLGAVGGAVLGGVLGNQVGGGTGKKIATVVGAVGGGYAGHQVEKHARASSQWEIAVRFEDGSSQVFTENAAPPWRSGDRVKVVSGRITAN
jgi:outer membrane lipoprotein SlyB